MTPAAECAIESSSSSGFNPTFDQNYAYYTFRLPKERMAKTRSVSVRCPFHDDTNPSMSIDLGKGLWYCHTCNIGGGMLAFEQKMFPEADLDTCWNQIYEITGMPQQMRRTTESGGQVTATYDYTDVMGKLVYQKLRMEYPDKPKSFVLRQPTPDGKSWQYNLHGVKKVLYRLPELVTAQMALVVEGEKDADNLRRALQPYLDSHPRERLAVTTNFDGAGKWLSAYNPYFTGRVVAILPDNDPKGKAHAEMVAASLKEYAAKLKVVELPDLEEKGDVSDWLAAGHGVAELLELVKRTPLWIAPTELGEADSLGDGWPEPMAETAFYGPAGEFVKLVLPETEADPHALLVSFVVIFGCMVGRGPFYQVEATRHGTNLFAVLVGDSAKARKGTAVDRVSSVLSYLDPEFFKTRFHSGLSSGEGLIEAVRDPREEGEQDGTKSRRANGEQRPVDLGVKDKRLLAIETEFASVLHQARRLGNTLSTILRAAWDGKSLRNMAKSNKDSCQEPHIAILGNITSEELRQLLTMNDQANGFGNRFLWCSTRRSKELPYGGKPLDMDKVNALVAKLKLALNFARAPQQVEWDPAAREAWGQAYHVLTESSPGTYGKMTARAEPQVARLAMLFALLDCSNLIRLEHLKAAQEVWAYCDDSARYIFRDAADEVAAGRILQILRSTPDGKTQSELHEEFQGHKSASKLKSALTLLQEQGMVTSEKVRTAGCPVTRWKIVA